MAALGCKRQRAPLLGWGQLACLASFILACGWQQMAAARGLDEAMQSVVSVLPEWPPDAARIDEPEGSGVVVLDGKTILTALHVVDKALSIRVRTYDGEILDARLKGRDRATDVASLTIDKALPVIQRYDAEPAVGDKACAIGNAFGLGLSVTCGVVSGTHRSGIGFNAVEDFIQTDAAVNPGASGGALVSDEGKFIGLLSAIFTKTSDANIGINFAVSGEVATEIARQLTQDGRVKRPISGARLEPVPDKGKTGRQGARVVSMMSGSLAEKAGLKTGDIIIHAAGRRVRKPQDFASAMARLLVSDAIDIEVLRGGAQVMLRIAK